MACHAEELAQRIVEMGSGKLRGGGKDADTVALERRVTDTLELEVTIDHRGEGL